MVLNGLRILVSALADPEIGVNYQIDRIPLDGADPRPRRIRRILDVTRDPDVLRGDPGATFPVLIIAPDEPVVLLGEINQNRRDGESISFSVTYVSGDADLAQGVREGLYVCRAIEQTIAALMDTGEQERRTRNGVYLQYCVSITYGTVVEKIGEGVVTAAFTVEFQPRNLTPRPE